MKPDFTSRLIFLAPLLVLPGLLIIWPVLQVTTLAFKTQVPLFDVDRYIGFRNLQFLILEDLRFWSGLANTLYFTGVSVSLELFLGLGFSLYLRFGKDPAWLKVVVLFPWAIPNVVSARLWQWMFHSEAGIINYGLTSLGLIDQPIPWLSSPDLALHAAILADVWKTTPFMTLLLFAGLQRIPDNLLRAARVDATPPLRMFRKIILPALNPVLVTAVILRMLDAFRVFDVIYVMTGGGPANTTETLSIYAYRTFFQGLQFGYGSSVVIVQVLVMVALTLLIRGLLERRRARA